MRHLVVGASELEREYRLKIFSFEENIAFQPVAEIDRMSQRCLLDDIVNLGSQYEAKILYLVSTTSLIGPEIRSYIWIARRQQVLCWHSGMLGLFERRSTIRR